jgi:peptide/nickel transport system substrate-binding protein
VLDVRFDVVGLSKRGARMPLFERRSAVRASTSRLRSVGSSSVGRRRSYLSRACLPGSSRLSLTVAAAMKQLAILPAAALVTFALMAFPAERGAAVGDARAGGTFRISFWTPDFDAIDPARAYTPASWAVLDLTCARLLAYPDRPPPAGFRLQPEVAVGFPRVSRDRKTYVFTLRSGFRFSNGARVRASAFARAINRTLAPEMRSPGARYTQDVVGAEAVQAGRADAASGVVARGNRLVIRLKRPVPELPAWMTMPFFCAVPPGLPVDAEGVRSLPSAGPYYVAEYRPGQRVVVLRNRFYRGSRPHRVDRFEVDLQAASHEDVLRRIESGQADWGWAAPPLYFDPARRLIAKYGVNRSRFFVKPGLNRRSFVLNTARPLFRDNVRLRRAVNFAVDRDAIVRTAGSPLSARVTDQYLPPTLPGFRDARIYPLRRPDVRRARALARGYTRGGNAMLYTFDAPLPLALAQLVKRDVARIGLTVTIRPIPPPAYYARLARPGEPFDIAFFPFSPDYLDPYSYINLQFEGRFVGKGNAARFHSRTYDRLMAAAARLAGRARYRAYGALDVRLARDAAPLVAIAYDNEPTFVSGRVGCVVLRPSLILAAACLKR